MRPFVLSNWLTNSGESGCTLDELKEVVRIHIDFLDTADVRRDVRAIPQYANIVRIIHLELGPWRHLKWHVNMTNGKICWAPGLYKPLGCKISCKLAYIKNYSRRNHSRWHWIPCTIFLISCHTGSMNHKGKVSKYRVSGCNGNDCVCYNF